MVDRLKISSLDEQIAYEQPGEERISSIAAQIAYEAIPQGISVSSIAMQIAYEEGAAPATGPTQDQLLRHGTWFGDGVKKPMWWAK